MKLCDLNFDFDEFRINIIANTSMEFPVTFVVSDIKVGCTYYVLDNIHLTEGSAFWIVPIGEYLINLLKSSSNFKGIRCKIYSGNKLLQYEDFIFRDYIDDELFITNEFDSVGASYVDFFYSNLCDGIDLTGIVIDAGANVGFFTKYALERGASVVCSIEPDVDPFFCLYKNFKNNKSVKLINKALTSDCEGTVFFMGMYNSVGGNNNIQFDGFVKTHIETIDVDTLLLEYPIINMFKLDIEGAEFDVIDKLTEFHFKKINQLFIEFHRKPPHTIVERLNSFGYETELRRCDMNSNEGFIYAKR